MPIVEDDFDGPLDPRWRPWTPGGGTVEVAESTLHLALPSAQADRYSDAQIDDSSGSRRSRFLWRPPLRLDVRARFSQATNDLRGTAGFGFWNYPLTAAGGLPRLPDAVWFFAASPPSNMALVRGTAGWGWKAQVIHARRPTTLLAAGPFVAAAAWARLTSHDAPAARWMQRLAGAHEALVTPDPRTWHDYTLEWLRDEARFWVDGVPILTAPHPPHGPLGFVAWIDNQYAVATPRGVLYFGTLASATQSLDLARLIIAPT